MTDGASPPHKRRLRYSGTHPRQFQEKYKELDSAAHASEVEKVLLRGQTPAGTHRSICVDEILAILNPQPGESGLDATLGFGGHTQSLLPRVLPGGHMVGLDVDSVELPRTRERLKALGFEAPTLELHHSNFSELAQFLPAQGGRFDFILADLGVSSMQIDNPARGFSFKQDGPLDLRLDPGQGRSASELLLSVTRQQLRELLTENADEPFAVPLAAALQGQYLETTVQLAELIRATVALQRFLRLGQPLIGWHALFELQRHRGADQLCQLHRRLQVLALQRCGQWHGKRFVGVFGEQIAQLLARH